MENKEIIQDILISMSKFLEVSQLKLLESTLKKKFENIECKQIIKVENKESNMLYISRFIAAKRVEGCSEKTLSYYLYELNRFILKFQDRNVRVITSDDIRSYLSDFQKKSKINLVTLDNIRRVLSSFFKWLEEEEIIIKSPLCRVHKIKMPRIVKEPFSEEEVELLKRACKKKPRNLAIIEFLNSSGIRVGELVMLNKSDINFDRKSCIVNGKGNNQREVYFNTATKLHLMEYLSTRTDNDKALFLCSKGKRQRIGIGGVEKLIRSIGISAGVNNAYPHRFRRTMATRAIGKGMRIEHIQRLLGHISVDTTLCYANINQENVKSAFQKIS